MTRPLPVPYTAAEAAEILRVTPFVVTKLCKTGALKADKPGDRYLIWPEDLMAYIKGGSNTEDAA